MCGIVYSKSFTGRPVNKTIQKRFLNQKHRGTDGFGFYIPDTDTLLHNTKMGRTLTLLRRNKTSEMLFHHRLPTSTVNVRNACHPFSTKDYFEHNYVVVHNGVLSNEYDLMNDHYAQGIKYVSMQKDGSFNDSEALAYDIASYMEGKQDKIKAAGSIAFIAIKRDKNGKAVSLIYGRNNGNPLKLKETDLSMTLSSEGDGIDIAPNTIYEFNYDTFETTSKYCFIPTYSYGTYGSYDSYDSWYSDTRGSGDYQGYHRGYDWEGYELEQEDFEIIRRMEVKDSVEDFMSDANFDAKKAFDHAQAMLKFLNDEESRLWNEAWLQNEEPTDKQLKDYDTVARERQTMQEVVAQLRQEAYGRTPQMGFQLS